MIISQSAQIVKDNTGHYEIVERKTPKGSNRLKWSEHKKSAVEMADKLIAAHLVRRGERMKHCGDSIEFVRCEDCGHYHVARAMLCRDRLCPLCSWRLALRRFADMSRLMDNVITDYPDYYYSFLTLTVRNCRLPSLRKTVNLMQMVWNRLRQRKFFKQSCLGWAKSLEITRNEVTKEYHPHYHIIMMWERDNNNTAESLSAEFIRTWVDMCHDEGLTVSIDAQKGETVKDDKQAANSIIAAVVETCKYSVKPQDMSDVPASELRLFATAISSLRFVSMGGLIADYADKLRIDLETVADKDNEVTVCELCKSRNIDRITYMWSFGDRRYCIDCPDGGSTLLQLLHDDDDQRARLTEYQRRRVSGGSDRV